MNVFTALAKALKVKFETEKESPYKPEFVEKIRQSDQQIKEGKFVSVRSKEEINKLLGL